MARPTDLATMSMKHFQDNSVSNSPVAVMTDKGNMYGFLAENEDSSDVYLQMFNKAVGDVTVGTTSPDFTYKILAGSQLGKDAQEFPLDFFDTALTIAITTTRTGAAAPTSAASVHVWHSNK